MEYLAHTGAVADHGMLKIDFLAQALIFGFERLQVSGIFQNRGGNGRDNHEHVQVAGVEANVAGALVEIDKAEHTIEDDEGSGHGSAVAVGVLNLVS